MGLGTIGLAGNLAATGLSIYGQAQQAKAVTTAAAYNNQLAQREAHNQELQTTESIRRARINNASGLSELRARLATSGLQTTTGAPLAIQGEAASRLEIGIADAARSATIEASSMRAKGAMGLWEAKQAAKGAKLGIFSTALTGLTSAADQYQQGKYTGIYRTARL